MQLFSQGIIICLLAPSSSSASVFYSNQPIFTETIKTTLSETFSFLNNYVLKKRNGCRLQYVTMLLFFHSIILSSINLLCQSFLLLAHHRHPKQTSQLSHGLYAFHSIPILILFCTNQHYFLNNKMKPPNCIRKAERL